MGQGGECFRRKEQHSQAQGLRACALVRTVPEPCVVQSARHALGAPGRGGRGGRGIWGDACQQREFWAGQQTCRLRTSPRRRLVIKLLCPEEQ